MIEDKIVVVHDIDLDKNPEHKDYEIVRLISSTLEIVKANFNENLYLFDLFIDKSKVNLSSDVDLNTIESYVYHLKDAQVIIVLVTTDILLSAELDEVFLNAMNANKKLVPIILEQCDFDGKKWITENDIFPRNGLRAKRLEIKELNKVAADVIICMSDFYNYITKIHEVKLTKDRRFNIFISYSHEDGDFADLLKYKLENENFLIHLDTDFISTGNNWKIGIDKAIADCDLAIVICSSYSKVSEYVIYEWSYAMGKDKNILPIMISDSSLHPKLADLEFIDFSRRKIRPWDKLIIDIKKSLNEIDV